MPGQRGRRIGTEEETGVKENLEKQKLLWEHSSGLQRFTPACDKSSDHNSFFFKCEKFLSKAVLTKVKK